MEEQQRSKRAAACDNGLAVPNAATIASAAVSTSAVPVSTTTLSVSKTAVYSVPAVSKVNVKQEPCSLETSTPAPSQTPREGFLSRRVRQRVRLFIYLHNPSFQ